MTDRRGRPRIETQNRQVAVSRFRQPHWWTSIVPCFPSAPASVAQLSTQPTHHQDYAQSLTATKHRLRRTRPPRLRNVNISQPFIHRLDIDRGHHGTRAPGTTLLGYGLECRRQLQQRADAPWPRSRRLAYPMGQWNRPTRDWCTSYDKPRSKVSELSCHAHSWVTATRDLLRLGGIWLDIS